MKSAKCMHSVSPITCDGVVAFNVQHATRFSDLKVFFLEELALHAGAFKYDRGGIPARFEIMRPASVGPLGVPGHLVMDASGARHIIFWTFYGHLIKGLILIGFEIVCFSPIQFPWAEFQNAGIPCRMCFQAMMTTSGLYRILGPPVTGSMPKIWSRFMGGLSK